MMNKLLINMNVTTPIRWILVAFLQFHPYTWYLFSAGMSEAVFLFFILTTLFGLSILPESMRSWVIVGFSLAAAFFTRYETLAMIVGVVLAVFIIMWEIDSEWKAKVRLAYRDFASSVLWHRSLDIFQLDIDE
jgi:4-amino-4-deoxy-L-arabinose transferase-like glycosyltransferase